jgi:TonB-linked SusC/RagA family outer membrane protein
MNILKLNGMKKIIFKLFFCCLFVSFWINAEAQNRTVKGRVTDLNGELPGVTVVVKGSTTATMSDVDGYYSINVPGNDAILVFSYIGYSTQEITAGNRSIIDVTLQEDAKLIDEVVVIGYGTARKNDLSMAVSTVKLDRKMKSRYNNINSLLQGKLSGVTIQMNGGDPLQGATYNIRGRGSRDGDDILWVVDGVPNAPYNIEDVESITVLKDAASAAIYGAQVGSGGVIAVTTRQAQAGKVKVDVNVSHGVKNAWRLPEVVTAEQYTQIWQDVKATATTPVTIPSAYDRDLFPYGAITRTNWLDEVFQTGQVQHYAVSLSGGSESIKTFASFQYDNNEGILLNTYSKSMGGKFNVDFQLFKWLKFSEKASFVYTNGQGDVGNGSHTGVLMTSIFYPRSQTVYEYAKNATNPLELGEPLYNEDGSQMLGGIIPRWAEGEVSGVGDFGNPVAVLKRLRQNRPSAKIYSTSTIEIKPFSALTLRSDFTAGLMPSRYENFKSMVPEIGKPDTDNYREISSTWQSNYLWETTASYAAAFDEHHISALAGYTMKYETYRYTSTRVWGFDREDEHYTVFTNGQEVRTATKPSENIWEEWLRSGFGRVGYSYADRYFATASLRYDATSKLHPDNNYGIFPAFSGSWKISSEEFFNLPAVNLLKLRAGWGQVGNVAQVPRYSSNVALSPLTATSGERTPVLGETLQGVSGLYLKTLSNPNLTWETTEQTSVGLDINLLENSLTLTVDWFNKLTKDLIEEVIVPIHAGIESNPYGNVGKVKNTGWEFSANYNEKIGDVNFNVYGNLAAVNSKVLDLGNFKEMSHTGSGFSVDGGTHPGLYSKVGQPWYSYKLYQTDGIFQSQTEIDNYVKDGKKIQPNARPGDLKFVDYDNDGAITAEDRQYMGSYLPELTYSFGASAEWKGLDLSIFFQGVADVKIFNGIKYFGYTGRNNAYVLTDVLDSWTYNHNSSIPRLSIGNDLNGNFSNPSDFFLDDGSYLRLKNITAGYTLPKALMTKIGLSGLGLRIYAGAENLLTFTKYKGFDPEVGRRGIDAGTYPVARMFNFGVNLNY